MVVVERHLGVGGMLVLAVVEEVGEGLEHMVEQELGKSSYNDASKLEVVVEQVVMVNLVALAALGVLRVLDYRVLQEGLVVHLVLPPLGLLVVP